LRDENHEGRVEARVQALLEAVKYDHVTYRKLKNSLKLKKKKIWPAKLMAFQINDSSGFIIMICELPEACSTLQKTLRRHDADEKGNCGPLRPNEPARQ
jgi:hypothetical protein